MEQSSKETNIFPQRLKTARERRGLNQAELATRASLQASAISHFETGTRKPSFDNLRRLADALDVTTDYLIGRVEDFTDLAGSDKLHRHLNALSSEDRDTAEKIMAMLAEKTKNSSRNKDK